MSDPRLGLISETPRPTSLKVAVFWPDDDDGDAYGVATKVTSEREAIEVCEATAKMGYGVDKSEIHIIDTRGPTKKIYKFTPEESIDNG